MPGTQCRVRKVGAGYAVLGTPWEVPGLWLRLPGTQWEVPGTHCRVRTPRLVVSGLPGTHEHPLQA